MCVGPCDLLIIRRGKQIPAGSAPAPEGQIYESSVFMATRERTHAHTRVREGGPRAPCSSCRSPGTPGAGGGFCSPALHLQFFGEDPGVGPHTFGLPEQTCSLSSGGPRVGRLPAARRGRGAQSPGPGLFPNPPWPRWDGPPWGPVTDVLSFGAGSMSQGSRAGALGIPTSAPLDTWGRLDASPDSRPT